MNILHYLNVMIGFSLIMLLLSVVTSFAAQAWLIFFRTKARALGNGLTSIMEDIGLEKKFARLNVNALLDKDDSIFGEKLEGILNKISAYFLASSPKDISREEFLLLLLRKASSDEELASKLNFQSAAEAKSKLDELEKEILVEETNDPTLPAQVWRTKAMQKVVPDITSKIFARFDEVLDRVAENVSNFGKLLGIIITLPLLLIFWPVDSIDLLNRLNNDQVLSGKLAEIAETNLSSIQKAQDNLLKCQEDNKNKPDVNQVCEQYNQALNLLAKEKFKDLNKIEVFKIDEKKLEKCEILFEGCRIAKMTSGIFITWILVSLGSAFWLGILNKILGIRSEFSKKLEAQREFRATSQK